MRKFLAALVALAMLLPPLLATLFALSSLTTLLLLTRPPGPKVVLSYPVTDAQGKEHWATVVLTGGRDLPDLPPEVASAWGGLAQGQFRARLSFFQGPNDDKLGEIRIEAALPLEEIIRSILKEQMGELEERFKEGLPPDYPQGPLRR